MVLGIINLKCCCSSLRIHSEEEFKLKQQMQSKCLSDSTLRLLFHLQLLTAACLYTAASPWRTPWGKHKHDMKRVSQHHTAHLLITLYNLLQIACCCHWCWRYSRSEWCSSAGGGGGCNTERLNAEPLISSSTPSLSQQDFELLNWVF